MARLHLSILLVTTAVAIGACAPQPSGGITAAPPTVGPSPTVAAPPPTAGPTTSPASAIVGEWVGFHECERMTTLLHDAGLDEFVAESVYGNGLVPGAASEADLKDPSQPCLDAVRRAHSHFFTASGEFGSRDFNGQRVDDGSYEIQGNDVVVINGTPFGFRVEGDELTLTPKPVDITGCTTKECRFEAAWVLMVAMPGITWTRGTIPG